MTRDERIAERLQWVTIEPNVWAGYYAEDVTSLMRENKRLAEHVKTLERQATAALRKGG